MSAVAIMLPSMVFAHILRTDGPITAELHLPPDDKPVAGSPVTYVLAFEDSTKKFSLPSCDCAATFRKNGTVVKTVSLATQNPSTSTNSITFMRPGSYELEVTGSPKIAGAFQQFHLTYPITIAPSPNTNIPVIPIAVASIVVVGFVIGLAIRFR